ncbi:MAG: hypothetical protein GZ094_22715 [Mariniphaga sp.]|nr:hypothetical protein [Mariniphaga sp.]
MAEITLTKDHLVDISNDMDNQEEMLTDAEINALAQKVNKKINLPFLSEEKELVVFAKLVKWIDRELYKILPNEYYNLINDISDGLTIQEANDLEKRLTPLINNVINIPILSEKLEAKLISMVLGVIIGAMAKGSKLEELPPS